MNRFKYLQDKFNNLVVPYKKQFETTAVEKYNIVKDSIPKIKDNVVNIHETHIKPMTTSLHRTTNFIKISAFMGGAGVFLFGLGYALNPIAKIIDKKNKDDK